MGLPDARVEDLDQASSPNAPCAPKRAAIGGRFGFVQLAVGSSLVQLAVGSSLVQLAVGSGLVQLAVGSGLVQLAVGSGLVQRRICISPPSAPTPDRCHFHRLTFLPPPRSDLG
jgi:hypothetical protein